MAIQPPYPSRAPAGAQKAAMPKAQEEFQKAVSDILEVVMFENWLRFYFIKEEQPEEEGGEPALSIELPAKSLERIRELYPSLLPLAEKMNGRPVDFETSRRAVLTFTLEALDGKSMPKNMAQTVFASSTFQIQLQLFHAWTQMHEEQLDQGFLDFGAWSNLFSQWRQSQGARELGAKLAGAGLC